MPVLEGEPVFLKPLVKTDVEERGFPVHRTRPFVRVTYELNTLVFEHHLVRKVGMRTAGQLPSAHDAMLKEVIGFTGGEHCADGRRLPRVYPAQESITAQKRLARVVQPHQPHRCRVVGVHSRAFTRHEEFRPARLPRAPPVAGP